MNCSIKDCKNVGVHNYDLYSDKKGFTLLLCKKHSKEADKSLAKRGLRVLANGSYEEA